MLLDTNALFLPIRTGFPLEAELDRLYPGARVLVADSGLRELDRLVERATVGARAARALAERFVRTPTQSDGDDAMIEVAVREGAVVVTADRELETRLRGRGIPVLTPRDRHRLELRPARSTPAGAHDSSPRRRRKSPRRAPLRGNG